ncbi:MAG: HI0074 family nucleotidyltransferase substrate-binding subunit [Snowella sp.]
MQSFEYTHELAWNLLRDYLRDQRTQDIYGSRDATRIAFSVGLIEDGDSWMDMIKDRNQTSHTYNKVTAKAIAEKITTRFGKKSTKEL